VQDRYGCDVRHEKVSEWDRDSGVEEGKAHKSGRVLSFLRMRGEYLCSFRHIGGPCFGDS